MTLDIEMADMGIDSLMGMELAREVETVFKCKLDQAEQMEATTLRQFVLCVVHALYGPDGEVTSEIIDNGDDSSSCTTGSDDISGNETGISTPSEKEPEQPVIKQPVQFSAGPATTNLSLSQSDILESFGSVKMLCDQRIHEFGLDTIDKNMLAGTNRLCAALVVETFDELGSPLRTATPGQKLDRVPFRPQHHRLMDIIYRFLGRTARQHQPHNRHHHPHTRIGSAQE